MNLTHGEQRALRAQHPHSPLRRRRPQHQGHAVEDTGDVRPGDAHLGRSGSASAIETMRPSSSARPAGPATASASTAESGRARSSAKWPLAVRRRLFRAPPHPSARPRSSARVRTKKPFEQRTESVHSDAEKSRSTSEDTVTCLGVRSTDSPARAARRVASRPPSPPSTSAAPGRTARGSAPGRPRAARRSAGAPAASPAPPLRVLGVGLRAQPHHRVVGLVTLGDADPRPWSPRPDRWAARRWPSDPGCRCGRRLAHLSGASHPPHHVEGGGALRLVDDQDAVHEGGGDPSAPECNPPADLPAFLRLHFPEQTVDLVSLAHATRRRRRRSPARRAASPGDVTSRRTKPLAASSPSWVSVALLPRCRSSTRRPSPRGGPGATFTPVMVM